MEIREDGSWVDFDLFTKFLGLNFGFVDSGVVYPCVGNSTGMTETDRSPQVETPCHSFLTLLLLE